MPTSVLGKHALLIGIQDYSKTSFDSLKGTANDLKLTAGVLRERFGFQDDDFIIIKDAQATHTGIENAFKKLIKRVKPNDFVYIFYSGHGSQTADLNGDERSGLDQTWVSYGARTSKDSKEKDNYDVLDDEIGDWLAPLYDKTDQVVFISDSCHSATVSRAALQGEALVRAVKKDERPHLLGERRYRELKTHRGMSVGAARDHESAIEKLKEDGQYYGLFTWYWVHNLQKAQAGETWSDVFKRAYVQVTLERGIAQQPYMQQPQMRGNRRQLVLGGGFTPLPPKIPVAHIVSKSRVKIQAGSLAGVTKGSVYRLYRPGVSNPQNLPRLTISKVTPFASYGKPEPKGTFQPGDLVLEESHTYHFPPIKVYLEADFPKDKPLLKAIQAAFQPNAYGTQPLSAYQITNDPYDTDLRLYILRPKHQDGQLIPAWPGNILPKSFPNQPPELWVLTPEQRLLKKGLKIPFTNLREGVKSLQDKLKKLARVRELKALQSSRGSTLPVIVQTDIFSQVSNCLKECVERYIFDRDLGKYRKLWYRKTGPYHLQEIGERTLSQGKTLSFSLYNKSEQDYYCYLINISPDDAINIIFPPYWEGMEFAKIMKGEKREVVNTLRVAEVGEESLKLIISNQPIDVWLLEQPPIRGRALNPLEQLLVNAVHGWRDSVPPIGIDEWATGQATFKVDAVK
ncbi:MAG: caspase family protein [Pseudomonadota bacterium]